MEYCLIRRLLKTVYNVYVIIHGMNYKLKLLKQKVQKEIKALDEDISIKEYIQYPAENVMTLKNPYEHVVLDNFFTDSFYKEICNFFDSVFKKGFSEVHDNEKFAPFLDVAYPYDGYVKAIHPFEHKVADFFYSNTWNLYLTKIFNRPTSTVITPAFHFHFPNDKTGWVHNDYTKKGFSSTRVLYNGIIPHARYGSTQKIDITETRAIAVVYYFGGSVDKPVGGGTGLYEYVKSKDPVKVVEPLDNRILAFSVSPKSYHAFQTNTADRKSIVMWLHVDPEWNKDTFGSGYAHHGTE